MPKSFLGKPDKIQTQKAQKTLRKHLIFHMKSKPAFLWGHLKPLKAFALYLIIQLAHHPSHVAKHHLLISIIDPSCSPSGCSHLKPQRHLIFRNFHGVCGKVEMKSQICTLQCYCYRTSTAAGATHWKSRGTTGKGCFYWRVHRKISCFPSANTVFFFGVTFIKLVQETDVLNLSSGYRHFIWSLHGNPK